MNNVHVFIIFCGIVGVLGSLLRQYNAGIDMFLPTLNAFNILTAFYFAYVLGKESK